MFGLSLTAIKWIIYGIMAATILGGIAYIEHEWAAGKAAQAQLAAQAAQVKTLTVAQKVVVTSAAASEKTAQTSLAAQSKVIIQKVPIYVPVKAPTVGVPCISNGLVRLHDAAALGVDPASLTAAGPDAACSSVAPSAFADTVARNYAAARANAEQLDALEADIHSEAHAAGGPAVLAGAPPPLAVYVPY